MKTCAKCELDLPRDAFTPCARTRSGLQSYCRDCQRRWVAENRETRRAQQREWYQRNRSAQALRSRANKYGISVDELRCLLAVRECDACGAELDTDVHSHRTHIDHCHATGKVRGVLCRYCNVAIGQIGDSPERARRARRLPGAHCLMAARVCDSCKVKLPSREGFTKCPRCKTQTRYVSSEQPMSEEAYNEFRRTYEPEKFCNEQILVVYTEGARTVLYDTAYGQDDARATVKRCTERHGTHCAARCVFDPSYPL